MVILSTQKGILTITETKLKYRVRYIRLYAILREYSTSSVFLVLLLDTLMERIDCNNTCVILKMYNTIMFTSHYDNSPLGY